MINIIINVYTIPSPCSVLHNLHDKLCRISQPLILTSFLVFSAPNKSELTSIFVSGFVVLIFVFVALHCGGGKTPPRPSNILTNGHSTMIQHPALNIGDRGGGVGGAGGRGFHPTKGGSMNFV